MGRILPDGSVFNPKVKARFLQQRVPIDEALARSWMSPSGVKAGVDLLGSIPTPEFGEPEKRAKAIAETRVPRTAILGTATPAAAPAAAPAATAKPDPVDDAARITHSKDAQDATRVMRESGMPGLPAMDQSPGATQETYQLQMQLVASGYMTPEEWATGPGILGDYTKRAMAKRDAEVPPLVSIPASPVAPVAPVAPVPAPVAAAPTAGAVIQEGISLEPGAGPTAPPAELEAAVEVIPETLEGQVRKFLADLQEGPGGETFEGQRNSLRSLAMQANTADAQDVVMRAMQYVQPRARNIRDHLTGAHKDRFRKEIMGLFPGVKKEEKPLTEAQKLDLDYKRERIAQIKEEREAKKSERDRKAKKRKAFKPKKGLSGKGLMDEFEKAIDQADKEFGTNRARVKRLTEKRQSIRDRVANLKAQLPKADKRGKFTAEQESARTGINNKINSLNKHLTTLNSEFSGAIEANDEIRAYQLRLRAIKNDPDLTDTEKQRLLVESADDYRRGYSFLEEEEEEGGGSGAGQDPSPDKPKRQKRTVEELEEELRRFREREFALPAGDPIIRSPERP